MDPVSVVAVADIRVIIVGQGGTHQYQVVDISDTSSPVQCAGLTLS